MTDEADIFIAETLTKPYHRNPINYCSESKTKISKHIFRGWSADNKFSWKNFGDVWFTTEWPKYVRHKSFVIHQSHDRPFTILLVKFYCFGFTLVILHVIINGIFLAKILITTEINSFL